MPQNDVIALHYGGVQAGVQSMLSAEKKLRATADDMVSDFQRVAAAWTGNAAVAAHAHVVDLNKNFTALEQTLTLLGRAVTEYAGAAQQQDSASANALGGAAGVG